MTWLWILFGFLLLVCYKNFWVFFPFEKVRSQKKWSFKCCPYQAAMTGEGDVYSWCMVPVFIHAMVAVM